MMMIVNIIILISYCTVSLCLLSSNVKQTLPNSFAYPKSGGELITFYQELNIPTLKGIHFTDLTTNIRSAIETSGISEGQVTIISRHTTTAITINEMEVTRNCIEKSNQLLQYVSIFFQGRLIDDTRQFLLKLAPAAYPYLHNDLHLRHGPPDWPGGDDAWREQEPINAHSHLLSMILGASTTVPIHEKKLKIGTWQSVILVIHISYFFVCQKNLNLK